MTRLAPDPRAPSGIGRLLPLAAVAAVVSLALVLSAVAVVEAQGRGDAGDPLSDPALRKAAGDALRSTAARMLPLKVLLVLAPLALLAGVGLLAASAARVLRGRPILAPCVRQRVAWRPGDILIVAAVWALAHAGAQVLLPGGGADLESIPPWLFQVGLTLATLATVGLIVRVRGGGRRALGLHGHRFGRNVGLGVYGFLCFLPIHAALMLGVQAALERLSLRPMVQEPVRLMLETESPVALVAVALVGVLVAPVGEEVLFRGFIQGALREACGARAALVGTAALFAAIHFNLFAFPALLVLGLVLGYLYDRAQSLVGPIVLHALYNGTVLAALGALRLAKG